jgi:copper oxidase (laccase) domain-containing protein
MMDARGTVTALGESTLTGWRGAVGKAVARPVAKRTGFTEEQVRVALGLVLLAYGLYRVLWPPIRALRRPR